ncbi:hypothetical protein [Dethiobacter alkaliphilus]|uniref:hypothetical protein n=1 Tax=Dethiobacter alkaliphilus TaxID=427926 RepID=UPI002226C8F2|nr:hypothetical protein [Dethiobacter alkaliphilus]MCW3490479.1 hypothetical protein [Dethiobacter alkaliphilus]
MKEQKIPYNLSGIIVILMIISSVGGLLIDNLYRDNAFVSAVWRGNDYVTLIVAVPIFIISLLIAKKGEPRALLIWFAMLWYSFYNYIFYLFGAAFNAFFLLYVALFTLSLYALIFGLPHLDITKIKERFSPDLPVKWISGYMLFVAAGLSTVYTIQSLNFVVTGQLPEIVELTAHPTSIVFAIDFPFLIVPFVLTAIWLWKRQPWGYALAVILNVKGAIYTLVLAVGSYSAGATAEIPMWITLTIAGVIVSGYLLKNMQAQ